MSEARGSWPALPLEAWPQTYGTLHMYTQIVGEIRLKLSPMLNQWWQVPLYVTARGLTTSPMPYSQPAGFERQPVRPEAAFYHPQLGEFLLMYDAVREAENPAALILAELDRWLADAQASGLRRFVGFVHDIPADRAAVEAAFRLPWSTGPVEGDVHSIKLLKRQGYGRAALPLLRARVLAV